MQSSQTVWSTKEKCVSPSHCAKALKQYGAHDQLITNIFDAAILKDFYDDFKMQRRLLDNLRPAASVGPLSSKIS
jgi:hypothetical protein